MARHDPILLPPPEQLAPVWVRSLAYAVMVVIALLTIPVIDRHVMARMESVVTVDPQQVGDAGTPTTLESTKEMSR